MPHEKVAILIVSREPFELSRAMMRRDELTKQMELQGGADLHVFGRETLRSALIEARFHLEIRATGS